MMAFFVCVDLDVLENNLVVEREWLNDNGVPYAFRRVNSTSTIFLVFDDNAQGTMYLMRFPDEYHYLVQDARRLNEIAESEIL